MIPNNINIEKQSYVNQNLITLIVGFIALGYAEQHSGLIYLKFISLIFSILIGISVLCTMMVYTIDYILKRLWCCKNA